jgi:hypothetical protein
MARSKATQKKVSLSELNNHSINNKRQALKDLKILNFDDPNDLNNYIKKLKDKGALTFNKGSYQVNKMLNPQIKKIEINII